MRVSPTQKQKKNTSFEHLTTTESVTKAIALIIAFVTVFFFFFKILFF